MGEIEEMYRAPDGGAAGAPAGCAATAGDEEEEAETRRALQRLKSKSGRGTGVPHGYLERKIAAPLV